MRRGRTQGQYAFDDGLLMEEGDWGYCDEDDRRFQTERVSGVRPAGASLLVDRGLPAALAPNMYDVGDGLYSRDTLEITAYDDPTRVVRVPGARGRVCLSTAGGRQAGSRGILFPRRRGEGVDSGQLPSRRRRNCREQRGRMRRPTRPPL